MNRNLLALILVFLLVYTTALWLKSNDQQNAQINIVQGDAADVARDWSDPVVITSEFGTQQKSTSLLGATESGLNEKSVPSKSTTTSLTIEPLLKVTPQTVSVSEQPVPVDLPQRVIESTRDVFVQIDVLDGPLEKDVTAQLTGPEGDLSISGRVLDRAGSPVPGIKVVAKASYLFDRDKGKLTSVYNYQRETTSGYDGTYAFARLADGEYHISTQETEQYSRTQISVRAGVDFADLVLTGQHKLRMFGFVSTVGGVPLDRVLMTPVTQNAPKVYTSKYGRYAFEINLMDTAQHLVVRAAKRGFEDREVQLDSSQLNAGNDLELNIVMEPDDDRALAEVRGRVTGPVGDPVVGQRIQLSSAKARQNYRVTTDVEGRFVIRRVEPGADYMLSINAVDAYEDYFQKGLNITKTGLTLNIELEALDTGTLSGQMVNAYGTPVPNFMLVLQTKETSYYNQRVLGDSVGNFRIEKAPAGELRLRTKSTPYYTIEGIRLAPSTELQIPVILDWGYDAIQGQVLNDQGYPVAVTNISLTWSHEQYGIRSSSRRTTAADEQGYFRFTQLGPGNHRLTISATGYKPVYVDHDVALQGSDLVVQLEAK